MWRSRRPKAGHSGATTRSIPRPRRRRSDGRRSCWMRRAGPVVLAGPGVARDEAMDPLVRFSERLNRPVATTFLGKGVFPDDHPNALGTIGFMVRDYANFGFQEADVVVAVGYDLVEYAPDRWNPKGDKRILHIHRSVAEVDDAYMLEVGVQGDIGES